MRGRFVPKEAAASVACCLSVLPCLFSLSLSLWDVGSIVCESTGVLGLGVLLATGVSEPWEQEC